MGKDLTCVVAGFGGQGSLFAGKVIATAGLIEDREVSWMPSYGPEMRGGTANCSVTLSDKPIGSPLITRPSALIALNQPSFDKFIDNVEEGGIVVVDTAMVPSLTEPEGVTVISIPATKMRGPASRASATSCSSAALGPRPAFAPRRSTAPSRRWPARSRS